MPAVTNNLVDALEFLLPGFLAAAIFSSLSVNARVGGLALVVQAFILTTIVQLIFGVSKELLPVGWQWSSDWNSEILVVVAIFVGVVISLLWNRDFPHNCLRRCGITKRSIYQSTQYSAFTRRTDCYVVIHLEDRRLFGWPAEWPSTKEDEYILLEEPSWITDTHRVEEDEEHSTVSHMLVPLSEISLIEFVKGRQEESGE